MNKRIPQTFIDDVITRTNIIELIQARVKIIKKGQNYSGLCPFHNEKSPSFSVNEQKQFYYCFGCGASGNAISFLMAFDHMEFIDALTDLSAKLGLELPQDDNAPQQRSYKEDYELLTKANQFYQEQLKTSDIAINYLKSRGLTGRTAKSFQLGYAPDQWDGLIKHLSPNKETTQQLIEQGLVIHKEDSGRNYDRFRNRALFPIRDHRGRTIAFGARTLTDELPKYINSPDTPLFHKSDELYGLYEVLQHNHKPPQILIVEGYMDVIALHQYGIQSAVATLGTATNPKHLQKLFRYTNKVVFCFDGDNAGKQAAWKALTVNLPMMRDGIELNFMFLTNKDDPDSLIRRVGKDGFVARLEKAQPLSEVFFDLIQQEIPTDTPDSKAKYAKAATDYLNKMPRSLFHDLMFEELAKKLNVYVSDLTTLKKEPQAPPLIPMKRPKSKGLKSPAEIACALLLQEPKLSELYDASQLATHTHNPDVALLKQLLTLFKNQPTLSIGSLHSHLKTPEAQQQVMQLASQTRPFSTEGMQAEFNGAIARLEESFQEVITEQLIEKAKSTELSPDEKKKLTELLTQRHKDSIQ